MGYETPEQKRTPETLKDLFAALDDVQKHFDQLAETLKSQSPEQSNETTPPQSEQSATPLETAEESVQPDQNIESAEKKVDRLYNEILGTKDAEISIFGTSLGLSVPLVIKLTGERGEDGKHNWQLQPTPEQTPDIFESPGTAGTGRKPLKEDIIFFRQNPQSGESIVIFMQPSSDLMERAGHKGVSVLLPADAESLLTALEDDENTAREVVKKIWRSLGGILEKRMPHFAKEDYSTSDPSFFTISD